MLDMSWGEVMLIGGVALIVIGPKDLPKALRTMGQVTGKLRRMAGEFGVPFDEAVREADLEEVRKEVDGLRRTTSSAASGFNPVQTIRDELKGAVEARQAPPAAAAPEPSASSILAEADATPADPPPAPAPRRSLADAMAGLKAQEAASGGRYDIPRPGPGTAVAPTDA